MRRNGIPTKQEKLEREERFSFVGGYRLSETAYSGMPGAYAEGARQRGAAQSTSYYGVVGAYMEVELDMYPQIPTSYYGVPGAYSEGRVRLKHIYLNFLFPGCRMCKPKELVAV